MGNKHDNGAKPAASREMGEEGQGRGYRVRWTVQERNMVTTHVIAPRVVTFCPLADEEAGGATQCPAHFSPRRPYPPQSHGRLQ